MKHDAIKLKSFSEERARLNDKMELIDSILTEYKDEIDWRNQTLQEEEDAMAEGVIDSVFTYRKLGEIQDIVEAIHISEGVRKVSMKANMSELE
eukprot:2729661-Ditylum_brightwellii.AAC.1